MLSDEQIKSLLEKNLEYSQEIQKTVKKIHRHFIISRIFGLIYFILIVGPIILGIIYLPDLLKNVAAGIIPGGTESSILKDLLNNGSINNQELINNLLKNNR